MTRIKRGSVAKKRRKKIISLTKGFQGSHSKLFKMANQQKMKALRYSYFDRRKKKNKFKNTWIRRINAASRKQGISYNKAINRIKKERIIINKKVLAEIIINDPETFKKLISLK